MTATDSRPGRLDVPVEASGRFGVEDDAEWYWIDDYDLLEPFLMSVVSPSDQWMFLSSSGALTAGRAEARHALFPYETDDRLHRAGGLTGPLTLLRVGGEVWQPFDPDAPLGSVRRSIAKSRFGDRVLFEEHHPGHELTFRYRWESTDEHGFVRTCELVRAAEAGAIEVEVLDGLLDVLPAGVEVKAQQQSSNLVDAYRRSEYDPASGMALFTLEALVSDRPEPAESLRANVVWSRGLTGGTVLLSPRQVAAFRRGGAVEPEHLVTGRKGAFLVSSSAVVADGSPLSWVVVADVARDHAQVAALRRDLVTTVDLAAAVRAAIAATTRELVRIVGAADALQETADRSAVVHHFANVLYNSMRGGVFVDGHRISTADFARFIGLRNRPVAARVSGLLEELGPTAELGELRRLAISGADADLARLLAEYLPLAFSRRHGDPSRPWNEFHITVRDSSGALSTGYEGNWRDVFQNWEALGHSFPEFLESFVAKFVNASTVDGFNPYRISDRGVEWEVPGDGAWSHYGYWGDHQIVYLSELLDASHRFHPGELAAQLGRRCFSYADVPYRVVPYDDLVRDPKHTIVYDRAHDEKINRRVDAIGEDGRLLPGDGGEGVHLATLAEKLLVPALSKLSNLVVGAGIWMNTQRPEWNDANNALVGNGVSMVTLVHLRSYVDQLEELLAESGLPDVELAPEVAAWARGIESVLSLHVEALQEYEFDPRVRRAVLDQLGRVFSVYRAAVYQSGLGAAEQVGVGSVIELIGVARRYLDHAMSRGRRADGLYDAYSLLRLGPDTAEIQPLGPMLEGQVAFIGSGALSSEEVADLVDAMFAGPLYRPDQRTFMLYPDRAPSGFLDKNEVPERFTGSGLGRLVATGDRSIATVDVDGVMRFAASLHSRAALEEALDALAAGAGAAAEIAAESRAEILDAYEAVFRHREFTGRSATMYRYEGIGSVYWHMVSKLLLAVQQRVIAAVAAGEGETTLGRLIGAYRRIRRGLGFTKTPAEQGTFPADPHSHTPAGAGAQQPGMTGQAKEGVLIRWGELGVRVAGGRVSFRPILLRRSEFHDEAWEWSRPDDESAMALDAGTLGFTYCGVPVVYRLTERKPWVVVTRPGGVETRFDGDTLDPATSADLFLRQGLVERIEVGVPVARLLGDEDGGNP